MTKFDAKLVQVGPRTGQDGSKMGQDSSKMGQSQVDAKMAKPDAILEPILPIFLHLGGDPWRNGQSVKTTNTLTLLMVFWRLGPPPEGPGGCLGRVLGAMLEDVGSKMVFFWRSWEMLWHLGAKIAHRSAKTRQDRRT